MRWVTWLRELYVRPSVEGVYTDDTCSKLQRKDSPNDL